MYPLATGVSQISQYLETKLDMLFEIGRSVEIAIILGKAAIPAPFVQITLPIKPIFPINQPNSELNIVIEVV